MTRSSPARSATALILTALSMVGCSEQPRTYSTATSPSELIFADTFSGVSLSPRWRPSGPGATVEGGHLRVEGLKNHPLWLDIKLPTDVQIEFDAWSSTDEGDVKFELAGDGTSFATTANYKPTGYVFVFGGWNNSRSVLAKLDEHDPDRVTRTDRRVVPGQRYRMVVTRRGPNIVWTVDGAVHLRMRDPDPLGGEGHEHFAFGGWDSVVNFDNLRILRLPLTAEESP